MDNIEILTRADYKEVFALSQFAFQYKLSEDELVLKAREADRHDIWGYLIEGALAGKLHVVPLEVTIQGQTFQMGGVSSVATWPEYRRSGVAKNLLQHALVKMKEQGQVLSYLHPFSVGFYRKYGWEIAFARREDSMPIGQLHTNWQGSGTVRRTEADISTLNKVYNAYASKFNGMLVRDDTWWQQRVLNDKEAHIAIAYNDDEHPEGYIMYKVRDHVLTVKELSYATVNGRNLLYEFIANHDSMAETVNWKMPTNNPVPYLVENPTYEQFIKPYFMARIVDVQAFLQQYAYMTLSAHFSIAVEDSFLKENQAVYEIEVEDGIASTIAKSDGKEKADIYCSIQHLTAIYLGYKRPLELYEQGFISGDVTAIQKLENIIPHATPFLSDFF